MAEFKSLCCPHWLGYRSIDIIKILDCQKLLWIRLGWPWRSSCWERYRCFCYRIWNNCLWPCPL